MNESYAKLATVDPSERVLLLSYCLRPSATCPAKFNKTGLQCEEICQELCVIGRLSKTALSLGYKGVCVAAGGAMALKFVAEHRPRGIVAVACHKELAEGVDGVEKLAGNGMDVPVIAAVPLLQDGCVDTEVDEEEALAALVSGCCSPYAT